MPYTPQPIDTTGIPLPEGLVPLIEQLAAHVHDEWALNRMKEGWTYGPERSDREKRHPGLVPYAELPETEKEYDRITAVSTIKVLLALGYRIVPESI